MNEKITIGRPFGPTNYIGMERKDGWQITLSWGGGMGGSSQRIYTYKPIYLGCGVIFEVEDIYGKKYTLNSRYIVKVEEVQIAKVTLYNNGNNGCYYSMPGDLLHIFFAVDRTDLVKIDWDTTLTDRVKELYQIGFCKD